MRIDAHQHFWVYDPKEYGWIDESMKVIRRDFLPADLKPELEQRGFRGCVAVQARQSLEETRWLSQMAADAPFILGVVGWVDLRSKAIRAELKEIAKETKLVGVRHIVQSEPDDRFLLGEDFLHGVECLEEFGLTYDILIYEKHLPVAAEFVEKFPRQRFVLDHLGKPPIKEGRLQPWTKGIRELAKFPHVYCKLSGLVTEADWRLWTPEQIAVYLDVAFECFGPQRLMIGSDWPVCLVAGSYSRTIAVVEKYLEAASLTPEARENVLGENARRFYGLKVSGNN
ncbi:MAG TPA: amidohydrolase family protein [Candidatus Acidoferrum sp.]|nr:amidohydrolase family protein [Candidatus Acidoferrum sp.]